MRVSGVAVRLSRLISVGLGCLVTAASCSGSGSPGGLRPPSAAALAVCRRVSAEFFDDHRTTGFAVSSVEVPAPLRDTGFGRVSAECAADPDLGIFYVAQVWRGPISAATIRRFRAHLHSLGFRDTSTQAGTSAYEAPPGYRATHRGHAVTALTSVYLTPASATEAWTTLMWI